MRIVRNAVLREEKGIQISMLIISLVMLLISFCNITLDFNGEAPALTVSLFDIWSLPVSVIPITWAICIVMLMKTKKVMFSKLPAYIFCCMILLGLIILFIALSEKYLVYKVLGFAVGVLLIYPFVIATLTIEGRMYNRVFATIFSSVLLAVSVAGAVAVCIALKAIILSAIIPSLIYVELILNVLCYNLEKIKKSDIKKENIITH